MQTRYCHRGDHIINVTDMDPDAVGFDDGDGFVCFAHAQAGSDDEDGEDETDGWGDEIPDDDEEGSSEADEDGEEEEDLDGNYNDY